jgi:hypothetical protein
MYLILFFLASIVFVLIVFKFNCPFCMKKIWRNALVCPYCGRDLPQTMWNKRFGD